jgi:FSR family fosmidomycin resistance protein-like MFS transporter
MLGHLSVDISQGALPAVLPFLIAAKNLNYTMAAGLIFAANITSSLAQPLFGYIGDKSPRQWFISLGLVLSGAGFAAVGFLDGYWAVFAAVMISGLGGAFFHPEGGRLANQVSGKNKSTGMSIFSVGGNFAFAVGPILISVAITVLGMKGTAVLMVPAFTMAVVFLAMADRLSKAGRGSGASQRDERLRDTPAEKDDWRAFAKLSIFIFFRSMLLFGMITFIPLYWVDALGKSQAAGSMALSLYSFTAAVSTIAGGVLADRYGLNKIIKISAVSFAVFISLFTLTNNPHLSAVLLIPLGFAMNLCFSTVVAIGQSFLPNHIGFASGITMGMGASVGGAAAPALGRVSDIYSINATFYVLTVISLLTAGAGFLVPFHKKIKSLLSDQNIS